MFKITSEEKKFILRRRKTLSALSPEKRLSKHIQIGVSMLSKNIAKKLKNPEDYLKRITKS